MGSDQDSATAGASGGGDIDKFQEEAKEREGATAAQEAAGVLKSDSATDVEGGVVEKLSDKNS
jgi:hypothetical protein